MYLSKVLYLLVDVDVRVDVVRELEDGLLEGEDDLTDDEDDGLETLALLVAGEEVLVDAGLAELLECDGCALGAP